MWNLSFILLFNEDKSISKDIFFTWMWLLYSKNSCVIPWLWKENSVPYQKAEEILCSVFNWLMIQKTFGWEQYPVPGIFIWRSEWINIQRECLLPKKLGVLLWLFIVLTVFEFERMDYMCYGENSPKSHLNF